MPRSQHTIERGSERNPWVCAERVGFGPLSGGSYYVPRRCLSASPSNESALRIGRARLTAFELAASFRLLSELSLSRYPLHHGTFAIPLFFRRIEKARDRVRLSDEVMRRRSMRWNKEGQAAMILPHSSLIYMFRLVALSLCLHTARACVPVKPGKS